MNRQITGTLAVLAMLAAVPSVSAQLQTPYGSVGMPAQPNMMPPQMGTAPTGFYGQAPQQAMVQQAMIRQAMAQQALAGQAMAPPGMAPPGMAPPGMAPPGMAGMGHPGMRPPIGHPGMQPPIPGPMPGQVLRPQAQGYPVQPATYGMPAVQTASHSSCDGCDSPGCDSCGDGSLLSGLKCGVGGCGLFGGCGDGCFSNLFSMCKSCGLAGCDHLCDGTGGRCLPRWFDAHAEWMYWQRDREEDLALSSEGIQGPIALNTNEIDYDFASGYRVTGAYIVGPGTGIEATYFGGFNWEDSAIATSEDNLFSVFSDFGVDPLNGFPETAFGFLHTVAMSSEMNNAELNLRRRFISANCHIHSSLLVGIRYFRLREDLVYETFTEQGDMSYQLKTDNDMVGLQGGGDLYFCLTPRFKIGAEVKAGVYGTHSKQRTNVFCTSCDPLRERDSASDASFLGDAGAIMLYRVTPRFTLRGGYQILYVDGVATAVNNFNTESPFSARDSFIHNTGNVFAHGTNLGFEWTW